jgi:hypothetical protein
MKKTKKFTASIDAKLSDDIKALAEKRGQTLSQMLTRMVTNTLEADRIAKEIRG